MLDEQHGAHMKAWESGGNKQKADGSRGARQRDPVEVRSVASKTGEWSSAAPHEKAGDSIAGVRASSLFCRTWEVICTNTQIGDVCYEVCPMGLVHGVISRLKFASECIARGKHENIRSRTLLFHFIPLYRAVELVTRLVSHKFLRSNTRRDSGLGRVHVLSDLIRVQRPRHCRRHHHSWLSSNHLSRFLSRQIAVEILRQMGPIMVAGGPATVFRRRVRIANDQVGNVAISL